MVELQLTCENHPDRRAIGVCKVTGRPICAECSTRIDGVNYSRQGLAILRQQRADEQSRGGFGHLALTAGCWLASPVLIWGCYLFFEFAFELLIDLAQTAG